MAGVLALVGLTIGCDDSPPSRPTPLPQPEPLNLLTILPNMGSTVSPGLVTIRGTGFLAGATVTLDAPATEVVVVNSTTITALAPAHEAGRVDVVVTNPGGQSARLTGAFTYSVEQPYTLTPSTTTVVAGDPLSVSWTAPRGGASDWIGFFKVGEPSTNYESRWWMYTNGVTSGTLTLSAGSETGQFEFRYLLDDGYVDASRSSQVTVTPR